MNLFFLSKMTKNLNKFVLIAYYFQDIHCFLNADTCYVFHVLENIEDINLFEKIFLVQFASNHAV